MGVWWIVPGLLSGKLTLAGPTDRRDSLIADQEAIMTSDLKLIKPFVCANCLWSSAGSFKTSTTGRKNLPVKDPRWDWFSIVNFSLFIIIRSRSIVHEIGNWTCTEVPKYFMVNSVCDWPNWVTDSMGKLTFRIRFSMKLDLFYWLL